MDAIFFESPEQMRRWLEANHAAASELWVGLYKKSTGRPTVTWPEAVDQALCFGWIDSVRKGIDADRYVNRFTPRKARSTWSDVNIRRVEELSQLGLMRPAGLKAFAARDPDRSRRYSYEENARGLEDAYETRFQTNPGAWDFFQGEAPSYRRAAAWWVMSAKREETRLQRLATLIEVSERQRRIEPMARRPPE